MYGFLTGEMIRNKEREKAEASITVDSQKLHISGNVEIEVDGSDIVVKIEKASKGNTVTVETRNGRVSSAAVMEKSAMINIQKKI